MTLRTIPIFAFALLAGCQDQPAGNGSYGSTTPRYERPQESPDLLTATVTPVRIGELGPNFPACNAQGEVRQRTGDGAIPVRAAPFEPAREIGQLAVGSSFFICSRSHDQRWLGIVYDAARRANQGCGVSAPVPGSSDYQGSCDSGWVAATQVRLISGVYNQADEASGNAAELR